MNLISSIHDAQKDLIAEAYQNIDAQRSPSTDINIELYSAGWFDGLMGYTPELPHIKDYWNGYALGYREAARMCRSSSANAFAFRSAKSRLCCGAAHDWGAFAPACGLLGLEISADEIPVEKLRTLMAA